MIRIAVIGYGYWGPNIVRNFSRIPGVCVSWVCDINPKTLINVTNMYPTIKTTTNVSDVINDPETQAAVVVTPPATHFQLAKQLLRSGKHVLVEKPMTQTVREARALIDLAKQKRKILMVDHTFIYTPAIRKLKKIIDSGTLGTVYYVDSVRTNLGLIQKDSNVIFDLAVHDFSIMDYLFGTMPKTISATGFSQKEIGQEVVAHIDLQYPGIFVHFHVGWLSPIKIRRMIFVGTKKMLVFDDIEPSEKIKIYDKGVSFEKDPKQSYQLRIGYRNGSVIAPEIPIEEGLSGMAKEFIRSVRTGRKPITDGVMGSRVVHCMIKTNQSLRHNGNPIKM